VLLDDKPDFCVEPLPYPGVGTVSIYLALGAMAGFLGLVASALLALARLVAAQASTRASPSS
jgi:hypothetical protein